MKNRLKELRKEKGLTQSQLGAMVGLPVRPSMQLKVKSMSPLSGSPAILRVFLAAPLKKFFYLKKVREGPEQKKAGGVTMAIRKLRFEAQIDHLDGILFTDLAKESIIPDL